MGLLGETTLLGMLGGSGYRLILLTSLVAAVLLSWRATRQTDSPSARYNLHGASVFLISLCLWLAFNTLTRAFHLPPRLWAAPFDRLLGVTILVLLGWSLIPAHKDSRRWRLFLAGGFAVTAVVYVGWAPLWAWEFHNHPLLTHDPTGLTPVWDIWLTVLAGAVAWALLRQQPPAPRSMLCVIAALAIGSLLELVGPLSITIPVWSRLGNLTAGLLFVAAAVNQTAEGRGTALWPPPPIRRWTYRFGSDDGQTAPAHGQSAAPQRHDAVPDLDLQVEPDVVATQALHQMADGLGTEPAIVCLVTDGGELDVWTLSSRHGTPRRLGTLSLRDRPTLLRALSGPGMHLASGRLARDVDAIYGMIGMSSNGPVLLEPIGRPTAIGLLIAGRRTGEWGGGDRDALQAIGRHAATALAAIEADEAAKSEFDRIFTALEHQAAAIGQFKSQLDGLVERVSRIEHTAPAAAPPTAPAESVASPIATEQSAAPSANPAESMAQPHGTTVGGATVREPAASGEESAGEAAAEAVGAGAVAAAAIKVAPPAGGAPPATPESAAAMAGPEAATAPPPTLEEHLPDILHQRNVRYEQSLERLPWGVIIADADDQIVFGNEAAASLLHTRIVAGRPFAALFPDAERLDYTLHRMRQAVGGASEPVEMLFESPRLRVELEPLRGPLVGHLGTVAVLHHRSTEAASVAGQLLPALADALRAPMTSIFGYSDLLSRGGGLTEEQVGRFLHRIDANLVRMQVMLNNLLTVLELDNQRSRVPPEPVDVQQAVRAAVERAKPQFEEKSLAVSFAPDIPLPPVSADPRVLAQIIDNLLANAAQRSPQGGDVLVNAEAREDVNATRAIVISVHDRGTPLGGASPGAIEIDDAAPHSIGLTIVRLLAERQGGRAWAESDPLGARFHVRLPVRRAA